MQPGARQPQDTAATDKSRPRAGRAEQQDRADAVVAESIHDNITSVAEFYEREEEKISTTQSIIEKISFFFGSPVYFGSVILFVCLWMAANLFVAHLGREPFDEPPFIWLQGIVALNGLLITIAVLIRQNRMATLEQKRAHLNLQINLMAEQKTSKVIQLLEELRKDSPDVKNRHDPESAAMQMQADPHAVLNALEEHKIQGTET